MFTVIWYSGFMGTSSFFLFKYPSLQRSWMFEHDCLDTCCFGCLFLHAFCIIVFELVQRS